MIVSVNGRRVTMPEQLPRLIRGSNGVLNLKLKDYDSPTGYKLKTINLVLVADLRSAATIDPEDKGTLRRRNSKSFSYLT